jgi:hypothetical protein
MSKYDLTDTSLGLWVDLPRRQVLTPEFFAWFAEELQFGLMAIMIDDSDRAVDFSWREQHVEQALKLADPYAIEIGLTTWPYPDVNQLATMKRKMGALLAVGPVAEWETDQEFNWQENDVEGFANLDQAGDVLVDIKRELCGEHGCRNTLTTFTYHVENSAKADTSQHADRLAIQAYATDERSGKAIGFNHRLGPGRMQKLTLDRTMQIPGVADGIPELLVGHAAWNQAGFMEKVDGLWQPVQPSRAMRTSFEASLPYHPVAHNWWSAKFIYPQSRKFNTYSEPFLRSLRAA